MDYFDILYLWIEIILNSKDIVCESQWGSALSHLSTAHWSTSPAPPYRILITIQSSSCRSASVWGNRKRNECWFFLRNWINCSIWAVRKSEAFYSSDKQQPSTANAMFSVRDIPTTNLTVWPSRRWWETWLCDICHQWWVRSLVKQIQWPARRSLVYIFLSVLLLSTGHYFDCTCHKS